MKCVSAGIAALSAYADNKVASGLTGILECSWAIQVSRLARQLTRLPGAVYALKVLLIRPCK